MNINFELYKIFYVVATNKSISKGAEKLLISQPAVTQAIKNLEGQLQTTLFIRTKKGIVLTIEGEELYTYIKEGMIYFLNGTNKLYSLKNLEKGIIRIGASTSITENFLMPYIEKFHQKYPGIEIKIINQLTDELLQELRNGSLDIVIGSESFLEAKDLSFHQIQEIEYIFVSNQKQELVLEEILDKKLIIQTGSSIARGVFDKFMKEHELEYHPYMEVVSHRLVMDFAKSGIGIGWVVKQYVLEELKKEELYELKVGKSLPKRKIGYLMKKQVIPSYATKAFIELMRMMEI